VKTVVGTSTLAIVSGATNLCQLIGRAPATAGANVIEKATMDHFTLMKTSGLSGQSRKTVFVPTHDLPLRLTLRLIRLQGGHLNLLAAGAYAGQSAEKANPKTSFTS
jgi:hypothetical protein